VQQVTDSVVATLLVLVQTLTAKVQVEEVLEAQLQITLT
jgi:hypothetical protein